MHFDAAPQGFSDKFSLPPLNGAPAFFSWPERGRSLLRALPSFLTWGTGTELLSAAREIHEIWISQRLLTWSRAAGTNFMDLIATLPRSARDRLFRAPQLSLLLRSGKSPTVDELARLHAFIEIEEFLCGKKDRAPSGWSALGDYGASCGSAHQPAAGFWPSGKGQYAPYAGKILIDSCSPWSLHANANLVPGWSGESEPYDHSSVVLIQERLEEAIDFIGSVSATTRETIESSVAVICIVRWTGNSNAAASMSARRVLGMVGLVNLHNPEAWFAGTIPEAFVHEAIHSLIYRLELLSSLYTEKDLPFSLTVTSPWTANTLPLHSFVHACFVWFGLWNFWRLCAEQNLDYPQLRLKAQKGFLQGDISALVSAEAAECIQPDILHAIHFMFDEVRSRA
jgi:hypothetical protein